MIQVEVAILMELLALFDTLSVLAVGRVKLVKIGRASCRERV